MAAFDRMARSENGILITEQDLMAEADDNEETTRKVYRKLEALVEAGKLKAWDVYMYARYGWCLDKPEAILAYQVGPHGNRWEVNNCSQEANWEEAIMAVNREFGFEASQIRIVGVPYYEATDYQFIRLTARIWPGCGKTASCTRRASNAAGGRNHAARRDGGATSCGRKSRALALLYPSRGDGAAAQAEGSVPLPPAGNRAHAPALAGDGH